MLAKSDWVFDGWIENAICVAPFAEALIFWHSLQLASFLPIDAKVHIFLVWIILKVGHLLCTELVNFEFDHLKLSLFYFKRAIMFYLILLFSTILPIF